MWQTLIVTLVVAGILVYVVRYYARIFRSGTPDCSGCSGCCGVAAEKAAERRLDGGDSCRDAGEAKR